jgi:hypothetical protein
VPEYAEAETASLKVSESVAAHWTLPHGRGSDWGGEGTSFMGIGGPPQPMGTRLRLRRCIGSTRRVRERFCGREEKRREEKRREERMGGEPARNNRLARNDSVYQ